MTDNTLRDAITRMHLAAAQIERDVRLSELTEDEWRSLARTAFERGWNKAIEYAATVAPGSADAIRSLAPIGEQA